MRAASRGPCGARRTRGTRRARRSAPMSSTSVATTSRSGGILPLASRNGAATMTRRHDADDPREEDVGQSPAHRGRRRVRSSGRPESMRSRYGARRASELARPGCAADHRGHGEGMGALRWAFAEGRPFLREAWSRDEPPPVRDAPGTPRGRTRAPPGDRPTPPPGPPSWTRMLPWLLILALVGVFALTNVFSLDTQLDQGSLVLALHHRGEGGQRQEGRVRPFER